MKVICMGSRAAGRALAWERVSTFPATQFRAVKRHRHRLVHGARVSELAAVWPGEAGR